MQYLKIAIILPTLLSFISQIQATEIKNSNRQPQLVTVLNKRSPVRFWATSTPSSIPTTQLDPTRIESSDNLSTDDPIRRQSSLTATGSAGSDSIPSSSPDITDSTSSLRSSRFWNWFKKEKTKRKEVVAVENIMAKIDGINAELKEVSSQSKVLNEDLKALKARLLDQNKSRHDLKSSGENGSELKSLEDGIRDTLSKINVKVSDAKKLFEKESFLRDKERQEKRSLKWAVEDLKRFMK